MFQTSMKLHQPAPGFLPRTALLFVATCGFGFHASAQDPIRATQSVLSEWIEVEKQISAEKNEWAVEKEVVENSIEFMESEKERLLTAINEAEESASAGERERAELNEQQAQLDAVNERMAELVASYESRIKSLAATWPEVFLEQIRTPLRRIPSEEQAGQAALTMRLQNVVVILTQFDKFNSTITESTEVQDIEGTSREVSTLYYGFAFAYFVDGAGEYAGYGYPAAEGWEWVADNSLAPTISDAVGMFDRNVEPAYLALPARIVTP